MLEYPQLQAEHLTRVVTGVNLGGDYPFTAAFGGLTEDTPTDAFSWDQRLPNRNLVSTFESRAARATNTQAGTSKKMSATLLGSYKCRDVQIERLLGQRALGAGSTDIAPLQTSVDEILADMDRRYRAEPMEYLMCAALQDNISVTIDGVAYTPDYGLASSHDLQVDTDWSDPAADIDADVETCQRLVMQDAGETVTDVWAGRNVIGYMRKNDTVKSWLQNYVGADQRFDALVRAKSWSMFGLNWHTMERGTHVSDVWTPYLNANKVIFTPRPSKQWFTTGRGICLYPTQILGMSASVSAFFGQTYGVATWVQGRTDPVALRAFHRWFELPVLLFPSAVVNLVVKV